MQNYIKTILSAFKTWTQKKIKESTADWNENDSSKSSHVKNRTHWEEQDGTVHKLDKKYLDLPTNLATTDDVQEAVDLANEAQNTANMAVTNAAAAQSTADGKMDKSNPVGIGSFSMNRKADTTIGPYSHAEGYYNTASGWNSHAEGEYNVASETDSHAEGLSTTASGTASHAEGSGTTASGAHSHAEGEGTVAGGKGSHAGGMYNISDTSTIDRKTGRRKYTHIIGNGTSDTTRSNAHTLDWEGNAWYSGDVYVGSTSGTNRDEGSKKLATVEEVQELASQISPQPYVAQTEAPEDKNLLWLDLDDESDDEGLADAIQAAIADVKNVAIPVPEVAKVG